MAKKSLIVSCNRKQRQHDDAIAAGRKPKKATQVYNRCKICSRQHGYLGLFKMCRICFRKFASEGMIPGVTKASW